MAIMNKKILIVEDDEEFVEFEREILEDMGYEVIEASNSKDGIDLAIRENPDLVLMDVRLPCKKRGIGTARILRNNEKTRHIPIIFVTGYFGECSEEIKNIPGCGYINKPFTIGAFKAMIEEYISKTEAGPK